MVIVLVALFQSVDYLYCLIDRRLQNVDLLEAAHYTLAARQLSVEFLIGR